MICALVRLTDGFQPAMVPSSVQNRNEAGFPVATVNEGESGLKSTPLTAPGLVDPAGPGMFTIREIAVPVPSYSVEVPVPLLPIQKGLPPLNPLPHGFTRFLSTWSATSGKSDTRLCTR